MEIPDLHKMNLHDIITLDNGVSVLRVPEFWIYTFPNGASEKIPYSYEFSGKRKLQVTKEIVAKIVANHFRLPIDFYKKPHGVKPTGKAKRILACILSDELKLRYDEIADFTHRKTHSNSLLAVKNLKHEMNYNDELHNEYKGILVKIEQHKSTKIY